MVSGEWSRLSIFVVAATCAAIAALGWFASASAADTPTVFGPTYPLPGYDDAAHHTHGGSNCESAGSVQGGSTLIWTLGSDPSTSAPTGLGGTNSCVDSSTPAFDTTRFQALYWSIDPTNTDFDECTNQSSTPGMCTGAANDSGHMTYDATDSHPTSGVVVYQGLTDPNDKLTLTFETVGASPVAIPLTDASTIGTFHTGTITAANLGWVVQVTQQVPRFQVLMNYSQDGAAMPSGDCTCSDHVNLWGGFYWVDQPPEGDFTYSTPANHEPVSLTVGTLSDPDGTVASYSWDLNGDGTYGDDANTSNPSTADLGPGQHTIGLQIVDNDGITTDVTHTFTITNQVPSGDFTYPTPANHQSVTFHATGITDPDQGDSAAPTYTWDLNGDGTYGDDPGADATATFGPGQHTVGLEITDSDGGVTDVTHTFTITNQVPTGSISIPSPGADPPGNHESVTFRASVNDPDEGTSAAPIYAWDLSGGTNYVTDPNADATTTFGPGQHTVAALVTDSDGATTRITKTFTITNALPTGDFTYPPPANHQSVTFTTTGIADPDQDPNAAGPTYSWDLNGDGTYGDDPGTDATATFGPGQHTVGLQITDSDGGVYDITHTFTITNALPTGDFTFGTSANHRPVTFHATGITDPDQDPNAAAPTYSWDLNGDGTYGDSPGADATQTYGPGTHTVGLQITDSDGGVTDVTHTFKITNKVPVASFSCLPAAIIAGQTVTCTSSEVDPDAAPGDPALFEQWSANGEPKTGASITFTMPAGTHAVTLVVTDRDRGSAVVTHVLVVHPATAWVSLVRGQKLKGAVKNGIQGTFTANDASHVALVLALSTAQAKKLHLKATIASAAPALAAAGSTKFAIKLSKSVGKKLLKAKHASFVITGTATDGFGNHVPITVKFSLK